MSCGRWADGFGRRTYGKLDVDQEALAGGGGDSGYGLVDDDILSGDEGGRGSDEGEDIANLHGEMEDGEGIKGLKGEYSRS